ncbi:MAG: YegS/Rv2252/BmrU family lipid kinase [Clostridia bacterium]|nr:YegS/Rv2252/BmrU family lipid kinase [Clostridia bacterium]MBR3808981.1 YegS/Rv2252/BmrU family lipid kinase [Clostridia bacterium]
MKHIFIINPVAGNGIDHITYSEKIKKAFSELGIEDYEIHVTTGVGNANEFAKEKVKTGEHIRFYACGGDGTLSEVVNACAEHKNAEVAAIPLGSGNDFIRIFGSKEDLLDLKAHINGTPMEFDLIKYGDQYAINQCSMGLDAEVCAKQADFKKIPFLSPETAYTVALLYCFIGKMKNTFTIQFDDDEPFTKDVLFCVVGNSRWYGGGYMAAPKALTYDGLLDFVVVEKNCSRLTLLGLIAPYKRGEHLEWERTHFKRGKKITIKSKKPSAVNFDGEVKIVTEATFNIVEKAIKYVVPANSDFTKKVEEGTL